MFSTASRALVLATSAFSVCLTVSQDRTDYVVLFNFSVQAVQRQSFPYQRFFLSLYLLLVISERCAFSFPFHLLCATACLTPQNIPSLWISRRVLCPRSNL